MKVLRRVLLIILIAIFILVLGFFGYFFIVTKDVKLNEQKLNFKDNSIILYDCFNNKMDCENTSLSREKIRIESLQNITKNAFVAVEDKSFYKHNGVDTARMLKALYKNVTSFSYKQGASTISQQLIKNTHLSSDKTIKRKLQEIALTFELEKKYSKDEILELYLNTIYFGHSCYGIENASNFYFNKSAKNLNLSESAILAGLVKSPNNYSPFKNPDNCMIRRNSALKSMLKLNYITQEEFEFATNEPLPEKATESKSKNYLNDEIYGELDKIFENSPYSLGENCKVYTTINLNKQKIIEENLNFETDNSTIILNNKTGAIEGYYSTVGNIKRSPASVIKPLLIYAPALEENFLTTSSILLDEKVDFNGYKPSNYGDKNYGYISVKNAVAQSVNTVAVKALNSFGIEKACKYMNKIGIEIEEADKNLPLALGGMKNGIDLISLSNGYSVFADEGNYKKAYFVEKVLGENGNSIYEHTLKKDKIYDDSTAFLMSDILRETSLSGTAKKLKDLNIDVYAKTGTNGNENGNLDAYALTYTSDYTVGVWNGDKKNGYISTTGGNLPTIFAKTILQNLYKENIPKAISQPQNVVKIKLDKVSYNNEYRLILASEQATPLDYFEEYFKLGTEPKTVAKLIPPIINAPALKSKNGSAYIEFSQQNNCNILITKCYKLKTETVFDGKTPKFYTDNNIKSGVNYTYFVTPYYILKDGKKLYGEKIKIGSVLIEKNQSTTPPDEWWYD